MERTWQVIRGNVVHRRKYRTRLRPGFSRAILRILASSKHLGMAISGEISPFFAFTLAICTV
jgi:hypothetical protein